MNNNDIFNYVPYIVAIGIVLIVFLVILGKVLVNVGAREIAIKERRYLGAKMPPGRVVATEGEVERPEFRSEVVGGHQHALHV